jgi:hypothetical protein
VTGTTPCESLWQPRSCPPRPPTRAIPGWPCAVLSKALVLTRVAAQFCLFQRPLGIQPPAKATRRSC